MWVPFKYERLPSLCFWCGCLTHDDRDCELWVESEGSLTPESQQFGPWLKAAPFMSSQCYMVKVPGFFAGKKAGLTSEKASVVKKPLVVVVRSGKLVPEIIRTDKESLGPVWYVRLKTENCCLKIFVEIRVGEKVS